MRNRLLTALAVLLLPLTLLGQVPIASTPGVLGNDAGAWMYYENGDQEFVAVDDGGLTATSIANPADRNSTTLVTKWKDKKGLEQEVRTTFHGRTNGARVAASERHAAAVALQLESFPIAWRGKTLRLLGPSVLPLAA